MELKIIMEQHPSAVDQYRALMSELLFSRAAEGGDLPLAVESAYVEQLDALWRRLSEAEQAMYEAELAAASRCNQAATRCAAISISSARTPSAGRRCAET